MTHFAVLFDYGGNLEVKSMSSFNFLFFLFWRNIDIFKSHGKWFESSSIRSVPSPTMPRRIRDFYVTSARKFKLNNEFSWSDNKKNDRNLSPESMFCVITSLLVKLRKSLPMAFEDDTSVENTRPFLRFYRS